MYTKLKTQPVQRYDPMLAPMRTQNSTMGSLTNPTLTHYDSGSRFEVIYNGRPGKSNKEFVSIGIHNY